MLSTNSISCWLMWYKLQCTGSVLSKIVLQHSEPTENLYKHIVYVKLPIVEVGNSSNWLIVSRQQKQKYVWTGISL